MAFYLFQWTDDLEQKLADHGLSPDDFEAVVSDPVSVDRSRSSGRRGAFGYTPEGATSSAFTSCSMTASP